MCVAGWHNSVPACRLEVRKGRAMFSQPVRNNKSPEYGEEFNLIVSHSTAARGLFMGACCMARWSSDLRQCCAATCTI